MARQESGTLLGEAASTSISATPPHRTTKSRIRTRDPFRSLAGRSGYFATKTGRRQGVGDPAKAPYPEPPSWFTGTRPEWAIFWAHQQLGLKQNQDFQYLADSPSTGNIQVDFLELTPHQTAVQVQGDFWHYEFQGRPRGRDLREKIQLESMGIPVVWIDETNALANPVFYLLEARQGRDHSRGSVGF